MAEDPFFSLRSTCLRGRCHHPSFFLARSRTISVTISEHLRGCSVPPRGCSVPPRPGHLNVLSDDMRNLWAQVGESLHSEAYGHWSSFPHQLHDPGQITDLQGLTFLICVMGFS